MQEVLLFSGTSEGRTLTEILCTHSVKVTVCVATEYGQEVMKESELAKIRVGRMKQEEIEELVSSKDWMAIIDATHPYAKEVTENIRNACERKNREVLRLIRDRSERVEGIRYVDSMEEAAAFLNTAKGNIFITTGSKELSRYLELIQDKERIFVRILPGVEELEKCHDLGLKGKQIICMQGPFSEELNYAMMKEIKADWLVTKETAGAGGYPEKIQAAVRAGAKAIVIKRPEESGYSMEEILRKFQIYPRKIEHLEISLVGIGMGNVETLTMEALECIKEADLLIGAARMLEAVPKEIRREKAEYISYKGKEIISYIQQNPVYQKVAILLSGDVGFYSGARQLQDRFAELGIQYPVRMICGISSVVYFTSRLGMSWEDMELMSLHGRNQNVLGVLRGTEKVFALTSGAESIRKLSGELIQYGMEHVKLYIGRQLGSREEEIDKGAPADFTDYEKEGLLVLVLVNEKARKAIVTHGMSDEVFVRGKVPMTKEEVRCISLSKLKLTKDAVIYDIGAGTGSISVECARMAVTGNVYAIEKKPEALKLLEENKYKTMTANLHIVSGEAPQAMEQLPIPTHAFIGGSSGRLEEILESLWRKNQRVRVVVNAISLDTLTEITQIIKKYQFSEKEVIQILVSKAKEVGDYQMMMGQNPVYIVTLQREIED